MKTCAAMLLLILVSGCSFKYEPQTLKQAGGIPQNGSESFNQGWRDGCDSGMAAFGNYTYKMIYSFKKDTRKLNDAEYVSAWNSAYNTCRWYTNTWLSPPGGGGLLGSTGGVF